MSVSGRLKLCLRSGKSCRLVNPAHVRRVESDGRTSPAGASTRSGMASARTSNVRTVQVGFAACRSGITRWQWHHKERFVPDLAIRDTVIDARSADHQTNTLCSILERRAQCQAIVAPDAEMRQDAGARIEPIGTVKRRQGCRCQLPYACGYRKRSRCSRIQPTIRSIPS